GFVGRKAELLKLQGLFTQFAHSDDKNGSKMPIALLLVGESGQGKTRLLEEGILQHRIRFAAGRCKKIEFISGLSLLPTDSQAQLSLAAKAAFLIERLEKQAQDAPFLLHLPDAKADPLQKRVLEGIVSSAEAQGTTARMLVVAEFTTNDICIADFESRDPFVQVINVPPLDRESLGELVKSMTGESANKAEVACLHRMCSGNPMLAVEVVRVWAEGKWGVELEKIVGLESLLFRRREILPAEQCRVLDALAVFGEELSVTQVANLTRQQEAGVWPLVESLATDGSVHLSRDKVAMPSRAHVAAWLATVDQRDLFELHGRCAELLKDEPRTLNLLCRLANHALGAGDSLGVSLAFEAGQMAIAKQDPVEAVGLLEKALTVASGGFAREIEGVLAELYVQTGQYDKALRVLGDRNDSRFLLKARAMQRRGDYEEAILLLEGNLPLIQDPREEQKTKAVLGRLLIQRGKGKEALLVCEEQALQILTKGEGELSEGEAVIIEVAGLAHYALGELKNAEKFFEFGEKFLNANNQSALLARFFSMRGMLDFANGKLEKAAQHYGAALKSARKAGDIHGEVTYLGNLGGVLLEMGHWNEALELLLAMVRDLGRLGQTNQLALGLHNLAGLFGMLGDLDRARDLQHRGEILARRLGNKRVEGFLVRLKGDFARREGDPKTAHSLYEQAAHLFLENDERSELVSTRLVQIEALVEQGDLKRAENELREMHLPKEHQGSGALVYARLFVHMVEKGVTPGEKIVRRTAEALVEHCADLQKRGANTDLWRAATVLGRLLSSTGSHLIQAKQVLEQAASCWEEIMKKAPDLYKESMQEDADSKSLSDCWQSLLEGGLKPEMATERISQKRTYEQEKVRRLLGINKRLNSELRLGPVVELIIDTVIELTEAERGFLVLVEDDKSISVKVARNIDRQSLDGEGLALSRSIAEQAARTGEPVVTVDAADDVRFKEAVSVAALRLRSVLAVPLAVKGRVVGTIYVDHRLRRGVFDETEVNLVLDLADQAAIAIENARILAENKERQLEIEKLNKQLAVTVKDQEEELDLARQELRSNRQALSVRYDYADIVGRAPQMLELFHLLDRVTDTNLSVVLRGESGTGKELVARAIHYNGPRSGKPFVGENCSAIPETLLESVLFGHVRGAFTGADRDRRGLFEVADGGTLFLDEVGEMSPAMQTKLLRVLQDGEFRPVGGEKARRCDVRIIAASNKDLLRLVEKEKFREDLYFRLNVVSVEIPCLRNRREDIPLLTEHFLKKYSSERSRTISKPAMALLMGYSWPGNVRELENEMMRVVALAEDVIGPEDLSPNINAGSPLMLRDQDDMRLRPRVE
ncbi:MAG: sigma 54-interacting transcriptional regulator, partial [Pseudomonadota bacterium]